jgi:DNA-binding GntR family transcriptional regulator
VYDQLRALILDNRIPPGDRVNIDALARQLGVSQTPVREAVRHLEGDGLVVKTEAKGYRTTALLDLDELRELFEFRLLIDLWAVREVAVNRLHNPATQLGQEIDAFADTTVGLSDVRLALVAHDTKFHGHILAAVGNDFVKNAYDQAHGHLHAFRLYSPDIDGRVTLEEHRRIAQAISACEPGEAEEAMHSHLTNAFHRFARAFDGGTAQGLRRVGRYRLF